MLQYEEETNFLHGTLKIHVIEARDLLDTDSSFFHIARGDWTDPYVVVYLDKTELCKTVYLENNLNPVWDEIFSVESSSPLHFGNPGRPACSFLVFLGALEGFVMDN